MDKQNLLDDRVMVSWRPYAILSVVVFALYFKALFFGFTYLDDNALIINSQHFIGRLSNLAEAFRRDVFRSPFEAFYRPVFTVSLMFDAIFGGAKPFVYHLTGIAVHAAVSSLLFRLLVRLGHRAVPAFAVALIFAVHPAVSQAVAWIPGRNDSLMALFALASFLFFLSYLEAKPYALPLHLAFFALALFTKEQALFIAVLCLFYAKFIRGRRALSLKLVTPLICWCIILIVWRAMREAAFVHPLPYTASAIAASLAGGLPHLIFYLGKLVWPASLAVLTIPADEKLVYGIVSLAIVGIPLAFSRSRRNAFAVFGALWFVLFLWPTFIQPDPEAVTYLIGHRVYLPATGLAIVILEIEWVRNIDLGARAWIKELAALALAVVFAIGAFVYMDAFSTRLDFWRNAVKHSPHSPLAQRNLGAMYYLDGRLDDALPLFRKSLELNPREQMAHGNVGLIYANKGMTAEAEAEYLLEIENNPVYDDVHFNLGNLYYKTGRKDDAERMWKRTVEINPEYFEACNQLAGLALERGEPAEARRWLDQIRRMGAKPNAKIEEAVKNYKR